MNTGNPLQGVPASSLAVQHEIQKPPAVSSDEQTMSEVLNPYSITVLVIFVLSLYLAAWELWITPLLQSPRLSLRIHAQLRTAVFPILLVPVFWATFSINLDVDLDGVADVHVVNSYTILIFLAYGMAIAHAMTPRSASRDRMTRTTICNNNPSLTILSGSGVISNNNQIINILFNVKAPTGEWLHNQAIRQQLPIRIPRLSRFLWLSANLPWFTLVTGGWTLTLVAVILCITSHMAQDGGISPHHVLLLFFSLAYISIGYNIAGVIQAALFRSINTVAVNGWTRSLYLRLYRKFSILMGNDPVIFNGTLFLAHWTESTSVGQKAWLLAEITAVNTANMLRFDGNIINVGIGEGLGTNITYTAYMIFPFLMYVILCHIALAYHFRHTGSISKDMSEDSQPDPGIALINPVGAVASNMVFSACVVSLLCLLSVNADVWGDHIVSRWHQI